VFLSKQFSDKTILSQLKDPEYQTSLAEHKWDALLSKGPCFTSLAILMSHGATLQDSLHQLNLNPEVLHLLLSHQQLVLTAMRTIAESYLLRSSKKETGTLKKRVPSVVLEGAKGKLYKPIKFLAKGSAGSVYTCVRVGDETPKLAAIVVCDQSKSSKLASAVQQQLDRQLVLKQIEPTQKNSAENEFRIAELLAKNDSDNCCVNYLDRANEDVDHLWLVLRRVCGSPYGVDLKEYITGNFFSHPENQKDACQIILTLLKGLSHVSKCGVTMRDVKADNVLIDHCEGPHGVTYSARWSDFGLAVDLGKKLDGAAIRSPAQLSPDASEAMVIESLIGFWYDTQKLVPKPKWRGRRPPERCFQNPKKTGLGSFDAYMFAIIIVSIAISVDIAHIDKPSVRREFERKLAAKLPSDYLLTLEIGSFLQENIEKFRPFFLSAFGFRMADILVNESLHMLAKDPRERPRPLEVYERLLLVFEN